MVEKYQIFNLKITIKLTLEGILSIIIDVAFMEVI